MGFFEKIWSNKYIRRIFSVLGFILAFLGVIFSIVTMDSSDARIRDVAMMAYISVYIMAIASSIIAVSGIYKETKNKDIEINKLREKNIEVGREIDTLKTEKDREFERLNTILERLKLYSKKKSTDLQSYEAMQKDKSVKDVISKGKHFGIASIIGELKELINSLEDSGCKHYERLYLLATDLTTNSTDNKTTKDVNDIEYYLFYTGQNSFENDERLIYKRLNLSQLDREKEYLRTLKNDYIIKDECYSLFLPLSINYNYNINEIYGFFKVDFLGEPKNRDMIKNITIAIQYDLSYYIYRMLNSIRDKLVVDDSEDLLQELHKYITNTEEVIK
ncbi:hypothetical protein ACQRD4_01685 [Streptococcus hyointestinalis]|uniref:hypothetical protein n=1 Tax=Streptococcus hyointestinalis TaxID=1337 RepID=UPI003CFC0AA5